MPFDLKKAETQRQWERLIDVQNPLNVHRPMSCFDSAARVVAMEHLEEATRRYPDACHQLYGGMWLAAETTMNIPCAHDPKSTEGKEVKKSLRASTRDEVPRPAFVIFTARIIWVCFATP